MKVLHISECIKGGITTYLNELYDNKNIEHDFYFFIPKNHSCYLSDKILNEDKVIPFNREKRNIQFFVSFFIFLIKNIRKINPDIIHLHSTFAGFFVRIYYFFLLKRPKIIYCSHGWSFLMDVSIFKKKLFLFIEKLLSLKTDSIINISDFDYNNSIALGLPKNKSIKIINTINSIKKQRNKKILNHVDNKLNFLFLGRLDRQKGFDKLFDYFCGNKKYVLHVVGDSVNTKSIEYPMCENIFFYGWIDHADIHNCYIDSDIVIIPSRWEGFGLVAIEAMKYSKPIIASKRGALSEIVKDGENGFLFNFSNFQSSLDSKINLLVDLGVEKISEKSYLMFIENYSKNDMVNQIYNLYLDLLKSK